MSTALEALDWALTALAAGALGSNWALHWAVDKKRRSQSAPHGERPAISILKPLCGLDEGLYENLVSFAEQDYPEFEIVFGVADPRDPVLPLVHKLRAAYPRVRIRLVVHGERDPIANPKVISLLHMVRAAQHDHVLVSDSNVRVTPDYLRSIAAEMDSPEVGMVSNVIVGAGGESFGAQCENLHLNTFVIGGVCLADLSDQPCVVGKSMLMRRSQLAQFGGFEAFRHVLAEDYLLGQRYHAAGYRVVLSTHAVVTYNLRMSMRRFLARHLRWAQLRRHCALGPFCSELLLYSSPWLMAPLLTGETDKFALPCLAGLIVRIGSDGLLAKRADGRWPSLGVLAFVPVKDSLLLGVWAIALVRRSVAWRGHALRIGAGSRLLPGTPPRFAGWRERLAQLTH